MNILIIANQSGTALKPLTDDTSLALLPVVGKTLLEHAIEFATELSPIHITIACSRQLPNIRALVEDGKRWGTPISIIAVKIDEQVVNVVSSNSHLQKKDLLVIPVDRLFSHSLDNIVNQFEEFAHARHVHDRTTGIHLFKPDYFDADHSNDTQSVSLTNIDTYTIKCHQSFHRINMLAAQGKITSLRLRGYDRALGLRTGHMTHLHPKSIKLGQVFAGNRCNVHRTCNLSGTNIINHGVVVDRATSVENTVILDNTYIGQHLNLQNAIVSGDTVIRVDNKAVLKLTDRFLTSDLQSGVFQQHIASPLNQLVGSILCLLCLPLFPIAFLTGCFNSLFEPVIKRQYVSNKSRNTIGDNRCFNSFIFNTKAPMLRHLPLLVNVALGHIRLVGISPYTPDELSAQPKDWGISTLSRPTGLVGPTQLYVGLEAPALERTLSDTVFAQQPVSFYRSTKLLLRALCCPMLPRDNTKDWLLEER